MRLACVLASARLNFQVDWIVIRCLQGALKLVAAVTFVLSHSAAGLANLCMHKYRKRYIQYVHASTALGEVLEERSAAVIVYISTAVAEQQAFLPMVTRTPHWIKHVSCMHVTRRAQII